jgi:hypothetical protein
VAAEARMIPVVMWATDCSWPWSRVRKQPTGGAEVHLSQLAREFGRSHPGTIVWSPIDEETVLDEEFGTAFRDSRRTTEYKSVRCKLAIISGSCKPPPWLHADRTVALVVHDPRPNPGLCEHHLGKATLVCVSEWQASLFRAQGHECIVIPPMIEDYVYSATMTRHKVPNQYACLSAWNKGGPETMEAWNTLREWLPEGSRLVVGAPYGNPNTPRYATYEAMGVDSGRNDIQWLGLMTPGQVVDELARSEAVFRVNVAPETFGVTDAIAEAVGTRVHCLCKNGFGGAREALSSEYLTDDALKFGADIVLAAKEQRVPVPHDYRVSTIFPLWEALVP